MAQSIFLSVAVDRKYDRNCDIGRFELAYKQPLVTVPPYIGINLSVDGQAIRKPGVRRPDVAIPVEPYFTPRNSVRQSLSNEKVAETKKSGGSNSVPAAGKSSGEGGKSTGSSKASSSESGNTKGHSTKSEPVSQDSGHKASVIMVSKSESKRSEYVDSHHPIKNHPQPPSHPKVCTQTPYLAGLTTRRIVSRTSVSNNYTIPPTIMDRQNKATVSVNNVESTDLKTMKSTGVVKGNELKAKSFQPCHKIKKRVNKVNRPRFEHFVQPQVTITFPQVPYASLNVAYRSPSGDDLVAPPRLRYSYLSSSSEHIYRPGLPLGGIESS